MAMPKFQKPRAEPKAHVTPAVPIVSRRAWQLSLEGAGPTPCMTAAHNWLGCVSVRDKDTDVCLATGKRCCLATFSASTWRGEQSADIAEDVENIKRLLKESKPRARF